MKTTIIKCDNCGNDIRNNITQEHLSFYLKATAGTIDYSKTITDVFSGLDLCSLKCLQEYVREPFGKETEE